MRDGDINRRRRRRHCLHHVHGGEPLPALVEPWDIPRWLRLLVVFLALGIIYVALSRDEHHLEKATSAHKCVVPRECAYGG